MRPDPLSPARVLQALELFGPQARLNSFADHFDCWGLAQRVLECFDDGRDIGAEAVDETTAGDWMAIGSREELVPVGRRASPGHAYYWHVTPTNAGGHEAFAPRKACSP